MAPGHAVGRPSTRTADVLHFHPNRRGSTVSLDREFNFAADTHRLQLIGQIRQPPRRLSVSAVDDITELTRLVDAVQPGFGGRRTRQSTDYHHTFKSKPRRDGLVCSDDAYTRSRNPAVVDKLGHNPVHRVDRNREANSGVRSGWSNDRGSWLPLLSLSPTSTGCCLQRPLRGPLQPEATCRNPSAQPSACLSGFRPQ